MPVDQGAIRRLEASLALLKPVGTRLTHDFYDRLFARHPGLRVMFPTDMAEQEKKLFASLVTVVEHLRDPGPLRESIRTMGKRHAGYGAKPEHYPIVCSLLLESMAATLGGAWTPELSAEWAQALQLVSAAMIEGAGGGPRPPGSEHTTRGEGPTRV